MTTTAVIGRGVPIRNEQGRIAEWIGTITDVEDQWIAEERVRPSAKMEAIGRLAGGLAHDFNNQLQGVSGFVNFVLRDPALPPQSRQDLGEVRRAAERMASLTQQLLAFSRQQVLTPETLELDAAIAEHQPLLQRLIGPGTRMTLATGPEAKWVKVDRHQLLQVLMNLAINARDAMPDGGSITIRSGVRTVVEGEVARVPDSELPAGEYAVIVVADTGTGIAPDDVPHIFEPFFTTKDVGEGTGLGLATVHGITAQSRGHTAVESALGHGTTFTLLLPLVDPPASAVATPAPGLQRPRARGRLLVVDDEEVVRALMRRSLEGAGYEVMLARNGRGALDCLEEHAPAVDLVLSDLVMPVMGRRDLAAALAPRYPQLPLMVMSGYPRDEGEPLSQRPDVPFLQKPLAESQLLETIGALVEKRRRSA
ncbi:MAG: response regulator [Gemmatimonadales bacterium]|nr:response regulator [Gemmatimonadales bacterium]